MVIVVILAGGMSKRFTLNKLLYPVKGVPLVEVVINNIRKCREVLKTYLVVTLNMAQIFSDVGVEVIYDYLGVGPMGGIYTALRMFNEVMVFGGDMPFVNCGYIETLTKLCQGYRYACLPIWRETGFAEPLAGIYSRELLPLLEKAITMNEYSVQKFIKKLGLNIKTIEVESCLNQFTNVFVNINTVEEANEVLHNYNLLY